MCRCLLRIRTYTYFISNSFWLFYKTQKRFFFVDTPCTNMCIYKYSFLEQITKFVLLILSHVVIVNVSNILFLKFLINEIYYLFSYLVSCKKNSRLVIINPESTTVLNILENMQFYSQYIAAAEPYFFSLFREILQPPRKVAYWY